MEIRKLLIADSVEEFRVELASQTRGLYRVCICQDGKETLREILTFKPDLVVLDMMLPGLDGISVLEEARKAGLAPQVLATTKFFSDYLAESAHRLGVGYMMVKPCDVKAVVERLSDLADRLDAGFVTHPDPRTAVSNMLLALGLSTKLRGYGYLREAILESMRCPGQMITKELYPKVGKLCDASGTQVERSIRSAICKAWETRDDALWRCYFGTGTGEILKRPTNAVFISVIAERMAVDPD